MEKELIIPSVEAERAILGNLELTNDSIGGCEVCGDCAACGVCGDCAACGAGDDCIACDVSAES